MPSNPVDLEQREGRIHRYKGHAVRKNVAIAHGRDVLTDGVGGNGAANNDPWDRLFEEAAGTRPDGAPEIVPFWVYQTPGGAKIERHVPILRLSRDSEKLENLRRALVAYRMVFGQARQGDLLTYLLEQLSGEEMEACADECTIDLSPPRRGRGS